MISTNFFEEQMLYEICSNLNGTERLTHVPNNAVFWVYLKTL